ncbi:mucin-17-like [Lytechinus variegatus]|uniref:mucin-17-like n=1 Tax=Lytechinus variegatus TaxID=7654 RepID=UPI001BB1738D|nr:mucin-17-like [Lytechinus variegatus]XP_041458494.1 mucin-17-like [Lytechinus variegatus]
MSSSSFCTMTSLLVLSYVLLLHWNFVRCKLQYDPGGSEDLDLHDAKAAIGKYFKYSIPEPRMKLNEHKFIYEVSEVGTSSIPTWLDFNQTSHTLHGIPLITEKGFYLMKVSLLFMSDNTTSVQAQDIFAIDVDFEASQELTKKDILAGVGAKLHQTLYTVGKMSERDTCRRGEIKTLMSVLFDADVNQLMGASRISLITSLASFVNQPLEEFIMSSKHSSVMLKMQKDVVIAAGPGNVRNAGSNDGIVVSWPLPCATQNLIIQFPKVLSRNIASGHFRDTTGFNVINWYITKVSNDGVNARGRSKREAARTMVPTPKPSQTASVMTTTSLLSISSTAQSMQTILTSLESTHSFTSLRSEQTMSFFSFSTSGFEFPTTPMDLFSSTPTLTSFGTESRQVSLSQSLFMTSLSTFFMSPTADVFSLSVQTSLFSPTSHQRTTSYQTQILSPLESSTEEFLTSSIFISSDIISRSNIVFPSVHSTLDDSQSIFKSTDIISSSLQITKSPSISYDESVPSTSSVFTVLSSQSSESLTSKVYISSMFSSSLLSTLRSSILDSTAFPEMSSGGSLIPSVSTGLTISLGASDFESTHTLRSTSVDVTTSSQITSTPSDSAILSTSPYLFSTLLFSSEITIFSTGYVQTSNSLMLTLYVETSSGGTMITMLSTSTPMSSQIYSSLFSTTSITAPSLTYVTTSEVTTLMTSSGVSSKQDVSTATAVFPTSLRSIEIQSSDIVQSRTVFLSSTVAPPSTMSSNYVLSPMPPSTVTFTSSSSSKLVMSTLETSASGMIQSSLVETDTISLSSLIGVNTLLSTEDITASPTLPSDSFLSTGIFIDTSSLSELLSSSLSPKMSNYLTSNLPNTPITASLVSITEMLSVTQSYISTGTLLTGGVTEISMTSTFFQTHSLGATGVSEISTSILHKSSESAMLSNSYLVSLFSSSTSEFPFLSTSMAPSLSSVTYVNSSAPTGSISPSEQTSTDMFLTTLQLSTSEILSTSAFQTSSFSVSSMASFPTPALSSTGGSLAHSILTSTVSQETTSIGLESDVKSMTLFFSDSSSETSTFLSSEIASSLKFTLLSTIMQSPFSQSYIYHSTFVQPSSSLALSSSLGYSSPHYRSSAQTAFSPIYSATSHFSSHFSDSKTTSVPSLITSSLLETGSLVSTEIKTQSELMSTSVSSVFPSTEEMVRSSFSLGISLSVPSLSSNLRTHSELSTSVPSIFSSSGRKSSLPSPTMSSIHLSTQLMPTSLHSMFSSTEEMVMSSLSSLTPSSSIPSLSSNLETQSELFSSVPPIISSTEEMVMSSLIIPTPSPSVLSISVVMTSSSIISPSPTVSQTSMTGQTLVLPSLPSTDVSMPISSRFVSVSDIKPTPPSSSRLGVMSTPVVTTQPATTPTETTTEPENQRPIIQYPIDEINIALGDVLYFSIPEDTFRDPEDGLTFDLELDLLTTNHEPVSSSHWLQLVNNQLTLAGMPLDSNLTLSRNEYLLSARDSEGLVTYDAFVVKVQERSLEYNHELVITLNNDFQNFVEDSQNIVSLCDGIAIYLGDRNTDAFSVASLAKGSVVMTYSNRTITNKYCDYKAIENIFSSMAYPNGTPTNDFEKVLLPNYEIRNIGRIFLNICSVSTFSPVTNITEYPGTNLLLVTVLPASLLSFLFLFCFIIICCCYKRSRGGEEFLLHDEKPIFAKNRKPIYLDGELDDKEPNRTSHPVILPIDVDPVKSSQTFRRKPHEYQREPKPPPPQYRLPEYAHVNLGYDGFDNEVENNVYEMEPPTYTSQPILHNAADPMSLPPLYRLPPPYQSQDRGFFEESDI